MHLPLEGPRPLKTKPGAHQGSQSHGEDADNVSLRKTHHGLSGEASAVRVCAKSLGLCPTLRNPVD